MPTQYLTVPEYVARYGEAETIRLTDETRSGAYDSERVELAISDATDEVDGYLGKRYSIPIANPPRLAVGYVAILARELLFKTRITPEAQREADRVRTQLKDISRGLMALPGVDGVVTEDGRAPAGSATSNDATCPVFTERNLAGFGVPQWGGCVANWKR